MSWSDGVLTAARTDLNVTANLAVTASFAVDTFTLTYTAGPERHDHRRGVTDGGVRRSGHPGDGGAQRGLSLRELE